MQSILKQLDIMLLVTCRHAHHDPGYYKYTNIEIKEESREIERHTNVDITDEKDALVHVCVCVCVLFLICGSRRSEGNKGTTACMASDLVQL